MKEKETKQAVCILAATLIRLGFSQSESMALAWATIKAQAENLSIVTAVKVSTKKETKRVVFNDLASMPAPKTGRKGHALKEGQSIFVDFCKHFAGSKYPVISFYCPTVKRLVI